MNTKLRPTSIGLCYEDRASWLAVSDIKRADEAARWLAPAADIALAEELVRSININPVHIPLSNRNRQTFSDLLYSERELMLWNVTDGLTVFCGSLVPSMAKILQIPSLGSSTYTQGLCQHKHHWKAVLTGHGLSCPPGFVVRTGAPEEFSEIGSLRLPLFIKPSSFGNNAGFSVINPMTYSEQEVFEKSNLLIKAGLGPVLVEEFAPGREYSVWCFKSAKWEFAIYEKVMDAPYLLTEVKDRRFRSKRFSMEPRNNPDVKAVCAKVIEFLEIEDYVRLDVREDRSGKPLPIDINTGAFLTGRSFELACRALRGGTSAMFDEIVQQSWQRQID